MAEKLFTEFPPVPTEKWEEVIVRDLKGADYEKKLVWRTHEGFSVRPYYRAENLQGLKHLGSKPGDFPYVRGTKANNEWLIHQTVYCVDGGYKAANEEALDILNRGVQSVGFYINGANGLQVEDFKVLLKDIDLTIAPVCFQNCSMSNTDTLKHFITYVDGLGLDKKAVKADFDFNPMGNLTKNGFFRENIAFQLLKECIEAAAEYPSVNVINVDARIFNASGASSVQELAFALSEGSEYISQLTELGLEVKDIAKRMTFSFAVGSIYFMEIAKFRAARMLWANIVDAYGTDSGCAKKMRISATTSKWNQTVYDAYVNMLRGTSEAMSAAIAGVDSLEVLPFDYAFRAPSEFSNRIARNVQSILKEESHFDKIVDPSAGSYYIENLTHSIAESAWALFNKVEEGGGYVAQFKAGFIQSEIKAVSDKKDKNIVTRRETLLGTNQFPNFLEKADECITKEIVSREIQTEMGAPVGLCTLEKQMAEPLKPYRGAEVFEALRLATDRSGKSPKAFMLTFGNLAMCRARAQFSANFFAVAGIGNIDNNRFDTIEEGVKAALESKAEIVVACSSDEEYADAVPQIAKLLGDKVILTVAGAPACQADLEAIGVKNFINVKSNVLDTLKNYQAALGIKAI